MRASGSSFHPASPMDAKIGSFIWSHSTRDFGDVIARDDRWQVMYHLSDISAGLFSWYPFRRDGSLLQIGGGFGAHTGMFCDRCRSVTVLEADGYRAECIKKRWHDKPALQVIHGGLIAWSPEHVYDYIVITVGPDFQEPVYSAQDYISLLRHVQSFLHEDGKLLFAVPNRLGIQYLCGAPDLSTGIPFDGPNQYPAGAVRPSLSKPELMEVLSQAGFGSIKLYYPLPDHLFPQLIYTDEQPPGEELNERLRLYHANQGSLVLDLRKMYAVMTENGFMPFFANSFLAECGHGELSSVSYVALSSERPKEERFCTIIHCHGTVEKCPMYPEGTEGLQRLSRNLNALKARDIPVISHQLKDDRMVMPKISAPTLSVYLRELVTVDRDRFVACLDQLYQYILQSSEHVPPDQNALSELAPHADWGPILSKAYLEMIPVNCFYDHGQFLFFDQEFVKENCPAKYVMFRALNDIYWFAPHTERYVPRYEMQERYGLAELWPVFLQVENQFQDQLRQRDLYRLWNKREAADLREIVRNGRLLLTEEKPHKIRLDVPERTFAAVDGAEGKTIVLFGAGRMMEHYLKKYGTDYPPAFVVDNDESKWDTERLGLPVKNPQILKELKKPEQYRVIICSADYHDIAKQLHQMGIKDYRVYVRSFDELLENVEYTADAAE